MNNDEKIIMNKCYCFRNSAKQVMHSYVFFHFAVFRVQYSNSGIGAFGFNLNELLREFWGIYRYRILLTMTTAPKYLY